MAKSKRNKMRTISTFGEAVDFLGGHTAVAAWLGTSANNVVMMKSRGYCARGYHLPVYLTLVKRGCRPAPAVFGLKTWDRLIMPRRSDAKMKHAA